MKYFSITQAISYAFRSYFKNWRFFGTIFIGLIFMFLGFDFFIINFKTNIRFLDLGYDFRFITFTSKVIFTTIIGIVIFFYSVFLNKLFLENYDGKFFRLNKFFSVDSNKMGFYLVTSFLYNLIAGIFYAIPISILDYIFHSKINIWHDHFLMVIVGFLILIFPAVIISSKYLFADCFALEKGGTIAQNFTESSNLVYGQTRKLVMFFYVFGISSILVWIVLSGLLMFAYLMLISIFSMITGLHNWGLEYVFSPLKAFPWFCIFGFIIPILLLIKVSIYKQLSGNTNACVICF